MLKLKVRQVGNSAGLVLPKEALTRLDVTVGDEVYLQESPNGGYNLAQYDPEFGEQMAAIESVGRQFRNALRKLAE
jgi:putative addiction module antidote